MKNFDLNIGKILENWEIYHAIREIIANAFDEQVLTNTAEVEILKINNVWCIRDFGRGLNYKHLTQDENPEKINNDKLIGRFGVGLKDALATLYRHNVKVEIQSKYGAITLKESTKNTFDDITTLHAQILPAVDDKMIGTTFYLHDCPDCEIEKAKSMFLRFSRAEIIETTTYGQVILKTSNTANIYINGVKISEEPNFAFSYNITALSKQIKKALNRERTNVGRSAYAERIKSILLEAKDEKILHILGNNLESMSNGTQCDEVKWVDVATHIVKAIDDSKETVFVTPNEIINTSGSTGEILQNSGKRIIFVPENVKKKAEQEHIHITTIESVVQEYNDSFDYTFISYGQLSLSEKSNWDKALSLLQILGFSNWISKCEISEKIKEESMCDTVGVWDLNINKIVIKRSQLSSLSTLCGTLVHEIIHASTGAADVSRYFETKLTNIIGIIGEKLITSGDINSQSSLIISDNQFADSELTKKYALLLEKYKALLDSLK